MFSQEMLTLKHFKNPEETRVFTVVGSVNTCNSWFGDSRFKYNKLRT